MYKYIALRLIYGDVWFKTSNCVRAHRCRGLGLDALVLKFLHLYCDPCSLVLVLGINPEEEVGCPAVISPCSVQ